ncbi:unnamed protein product [Prorocentrum cordatum]|uniref:C3H1-type domain-containing protein n=1 Tax=Prorocentrum cordatum TaxID=2364126 RepID=A0ABN9TGD0_9DINO|nr:unnamed protein product [Polarella glacialis]|mmetsp:Transcript_17352/g.46307  ORF Transcript_17352/g.46307 Transcript_17352/m.46307 type:complete len:471 (+) Transcript_17352:103-1515(+)
MGLQTHEIEICFSALRSALQKAEESLKNLAAKHEEKQEKDTASLKARAEASEKEAKAAKEAQREAEERDERTQEKLQQKRDEAKELSNQLEKLSERLEDKRQEYVRLDEYVTKLQDRHPGRRERPPEKRPKLKCEDRSRTPQLDRRSDSESRRGAAASTMAALESGGGQKSRDRSASRSLGGHSRGVLPRGGGHDADSLRGGAAERGAGSMQLSLREEDAALDEGGRGDGKPISRQRGLTGVAAEDDRAPIPRRGRPEPPRVVLGDIPRGGDRQDEQRRSRSRSASRGPIPRDKSAEIRRRGGRGSSGGKSCGKGAAAVARRPGGGEGQGGSSAPEPSKSLCFLYVIDKCSKGAQCRDRHPDKYEVKALRDKMSDTMCRFGAKCGRPDCVFRHPPGRVLPLDQRPAIQERRSSGRSPIRRAGGDRKDGGDGRSPIRRSGVAAGSREDREQLSPIRRSGGAAAQAQAKDSS